MTTNPIRFNNGSKSIRLHRLKTWTEYFEKVDSGIKTAELRKSDRDYQVGDILQLEEFDPSQQSFSGSKCWREITDILHGGSFGLEAGFVMLSMKRVENPWVGMSVRGVNEVLGEGDR